MRRDRVLVFGLLLVGLAVIVMRPADAQQTLAAQDATLQQAVVQLRTMNDALRTLRLVGTSGLAAPVGVVVRQPVPPLDPCSGIKGNVAISQTANTRLISGSRRIAICSLFVVGADAENLSLVEGSGATCGTSTAAVIGGATAANGPNMAANGGWVLGNGEATVASQATPGFDLCLFQSGSGRVAGNLTFVFQ